MEITAFISAATDRLAQQSQQLEKWNSSYSEEQWNQKSNSGSWSAAETLEHINSFNSLYFPTLMAKLTASRNRTSEKIKLGMLGAWIIKSMQPTSEGVIKSKMKTAGMLKPKSE